MAESPAPMRGYSGRDAPDMAEARRCVRCGLCLPHCPTYLETLRETSSPRGRIHLIEAVGEGKLDLLSPGFVAQMRQCLDCRACEAACPSGVQYGHLLEAARAQVAQAQPATSRAISAATLDALFGDLRRFHAAAKLLRRYQSLGGAQLARATGLLRLLGMDDAEALLPPIPEHFFMPTGQRYEPETPTKPTVALLAGCVMGTVCAPTDRATVRVLSALGWPVVVPEGQQCCGAIATHVGEPDRARTLARRNISAFAVTGADLVITNAAGCGAALKDYGHLLADDPAWAERAADFSERVRDITELLAADLADWRQRLQPIPLRVTYQEPCHLAHAQRVSQPPRDLLRAIPALELVEMSEAALCCGSAGTYNLMQPEMAARLQVRKIANIQAAEADLVVTANPGCWLQVRAGLRKVGDTTGVIHIIDLLDASLRGLPVAEVRAVETAPGRVGE
jgi:glycolate oxidase iron-sulfur subunit